MKKKIFVALAIAALAMTACGSKEDTKATTATTAAVEAVEDTAEASEERIAVEVPNAEKGEEVQGEEAPEALGGSPEDLEGAENIEEDGEEETEAETLTVEQEMGNQEVVAEAESLAAELEAALAEAKTEEEIHDVYQGYMTFLSGEVADVKESEDATIYTVSTEIGNIEFYATEDTEVGDRVQQGSLVTVMYDGFTTYDNVPQAHTVTWIKLTEDYEAEEAAFEESRAAADEAEYEAEDEVAAAKGPGDDTGVTEAATN